MRAFVLATLLAACGDPQGVDTGSTCPPTDAPTYANFGQAFFQSYCLGCHSQTREGDDRYGAPVTIDFDTRTLVRMATSNIDKQAAWGPKAHNTLMPPRDADAMPSDEERRRLGEYIACEIGR